MKRKLLAQLVHNPPIFNKDIQDTYAKKLEEGQIRIDSLIGQADFAIKLLQQELGPVEQVTNINKVIANYKRTSIIPYYQDKNDVISISSASVVIQELVDQQLRANNIFENWNHQELEVINNLKLFKSEYEILTDNIDEIIQYKQSQITKVPTKYYSHQQLDTKLEECSNVLNTLNKSLQRIVIKYISFDNPLLTLGELNDRIQIILDLINKLVKGLIINNDYLVLTPTPIELQVLNKMMMNEVVLIKDSPDNHENQLIVKLRDYSA